MHDSPDFRRHHHFCVSVAKHIFLKANGTLAIADQPVRIDAVRELGLAPLALFAGNLLDTETQHGTRASAAICSQQERFARHTVGLLHPLTSDSPDGVSRDPTSIAVPHRTDVHAAACSLFFL